jgi:dihydropteroate synthase
MGVLNVTPDSFSDGGLYDSYERAVAHGLDMADEGADVIDVGGESSRPGAEPVPLEVELARVVPVVEALAAAPAVTGRGVRLSVDTVKPEVAEAAVAAGASLINDISASLWPVAASSGAGWVAMHMQGEPRTMQVRPHYDDVVAEVRAFVLERAARARAAGVEEVWLDPGIGFGKTMAHNLSLLRHLDELVQAADEAGCAGVVVGTSRKRFLGVLVAGEGRGPGPAGTEPAAGRIGAEPAAGRIGAEPAAGRIGAEPAPVSERLEGSLATAAAAMVAGARMVRVHDVAATVQVARLYRPAA